MDVATKNLVEGIAIAMYVRRLIADVMHVCIHPDDSSGWLEISIDRPSYFVAVIHQLCGPCHRLTVSGTGNPQQCNTGTRSSRLCCCLLGRTFAALRCQQPILQVGNYQIRTNLLQMLQMLQMLQNFDEKVAGAWCCAG